ncbi:MAG: FAD-dependent oxidoreductase [Acidobacteriaceae bacterium]|nr:FAD-dependent oxidoreductase [Acidobacteriaceae bacterium]
MALRELDRAGLNVLCLEARDYIGGRILTLHDPLSPIPLELGAEFIHGRPPELWNFIRDANLGVYDCGDRAVHIKDGKVQSDTDAWVPVDRVMSDMQEAAERLPDQPFSVFLENSSHSEEAKRLSANFVEGFNAARKEIVGIHSLAQDTKASDEIDGDRSFRFIGGYDSLAHALINGVSDPASKLRLNSVVQTISWSSGSVTVRVRSSITGRKDTVHCRRVLITVPLGVLQAEPDESGAIRFDPEPKEVLAAARRLEFGQVFRVVLRFQEPFWEKNPDLADAGFLFSDEPLFPTWWTPLPRRVPILTGWSAGPHADALQGRSRQEVVRAATASLAKIVGIGNDALNRLLVSAHFHDWHADPFARGAYSYVPACALPAREILARPVENTLYFAGEAIDLHGHSATVHGAIASALEAASLIGNA